MQHLIRSSSRLGRIVIHSYTKNPLKYGQQKHRGVASLWGGRALERSRPSHHGNWQYQRREYGILVVRVLRGVLKIRYLLLGGAIGGGSALTKKYKDWRDSLPNNKWLDEILPDDGKWQEWRENLIDLTKINIQIDPMFKVANEALYRQFREWVEKRFHAIAGAANKQPTLLARLNNLQDEMIQTRIKYQRELERLEKENKELEKRTNELEETEELRNQNSQDEIMETQIKYERELERLEKEIKDLRKLNLLLKQGNKLQMKEIKKSLIDMYSEVLDELSDFDNGYNIQDQLPRVVVIGDQSSGKTSVLEMIAQARIFPRGAGIMTTRAPVKVTLSEGPYHVAQFRDSTRQFDLSKESDLAELRHEVELRMRNSVRGGKTVSSEVISMTVKGPGLQRMVLVDLPGIISTVTTDLSKDTRECIKQMAQTYMNNPNAIILCIQDGAVDAERSNVTDLVSQCDPHGKRTIFVLTKVDLAEQNLANPNRIRDILAGKLFPMKAQGYFAVVTGKEGHKDDSIQTIKEYEEAFFRNSPLIKDGVIRSTQATTKNLSFAVADCFWKMVRESIEQQADDFKARLLNLETEWRNHFPRIRKQARDELFERARHEILNEVVNLSQVNPTKWEELFNQKIWEKVSSHVFENIYLPSAQTGTQETFNTSVDIKLRQWAEQTLPAQSVESGWETLQEEFRKFMDKASQAPDHDDILDSLKAAVVSEAMQRHVWEDKASEMLRIIQLNTLEDGSVSNKRDWDAAVRFLENSVKEKLKQNEDLLRDILGPGTKERWLYWKYQTEDQAKSTAIKSELDKVLCSNEKHPPELSCDELTTIRNNLMVNNVEVDNESVLKVWLPIYKRHFLKQSLTKAYDCKKAFYLYNLNVEVECSDVVLFHRIQQTMKHTSNALRQQIINHEAKSLYKEIEKILEDISQDSEKKEKLLTGRRVTLAEELKRVRQIQEKLEEFIQCLNKEK